jgi:hypothetical protein
MGGIAAIRSDPRPEEMRRSSGVCPEDPCPGARVTVLFASQLAVYRQKQTRQWLTRGRHRLAIQGFRYMRHIRRVQVAPRVSRVAGIVGVPGVTVPALPQHSQRSSTGGRVLRPGNTASPGFSGPTAPVNPYTVPGLGYPTFRTWKYYSERVAFSVIVRGAAIHHIVSSVKRQGRL